MSDDHLFDLNRHGKITASIAGAILRCEGCQSRKWAWRVITGREKVREANWDQQRGLDHEDDAIGALQLELGCLVLPGRFVCHPVIPWLGASPDGFILDWIAINSGLFPIKADEPIVNDCVLRPIPVEAKCPRVLHSVVPDMYYAQVQIQLECCDAPHGYFVSWNEEGQWVTKIERDAVWWTTNYPILEEFYKSYIEPDIEPPVSPRRSKHVDGRTVEGSVGIHHGDSSGCVRATPTDQSDQRTDSSGDSPEGNGIVREASDNVPHPARRTRRSKSKAVGVDAGQGTGSDSASDSAKAFFASRVAVPDE